MTGAVKWLIAGVLILISIVAAFVFAATRRKELAQLAVMAIELAHKQKIVELQSNLHTLENDLNRNDVEIKKAQAALDKKRDELSKTYQSVNLSANDIVNRLARLEL
mgnify:CR=1 FL=1